MARSLDRLARKIQKAREDYYIRSDPTLTDAEYDDLVEQLKVNDPSNELLDQVGAPDVRTDGKVALEFPMLSLEKAKGWDEFLNWASSRPKTKMVASWKLDGCAVDLVYERHGEEYRLTGAATRGDGTVGSDVFRAMSEGNVKGLELAFRAKDFGKRIHVYGEVVVPKMMLQRINEKQRANGDKTYVNCRNLANGSLGLMDIDKIKERGLEFIAYNTSLEMFLEDKFVWLQLVGFSVVPWKSGSGIELFFENLSPPANRVELPFDIDGVVVAIDSFEIQKSLGYTSHHPRWAVAVKFADDIQVVTVKDIEWTVSRNGVVTPQAVFDPVFLDGATVGRCTLHNASHVFKYDIRLGTKILICRSNGVIPKFLGVEERALYSSAVTIDQCPSCESELTYDGVNKICQNENCPAALAVALEHFLESLDFKGLGEVACLQLITSGIVRKIDDLWSDRVNAAALSTVLGWSLDHAHQVLRELDDLKAKVPLSKLLVAMNIAGVGKVSAQKIAAKFADVNAMSTGLKEFQSLLGPNSGVTAHQSLLIRVKSVYQYLVLRGFKVFNDQFGQGGEVVVITGTLSKSRKEYERLLKEAGFLTKGSVTRDTKYLVVGEDPGVDKLKKAKKYGTEQVTESWLLKAIGGDHG